MQGEGSDQELVVRRTRPDARLSERTVRKRRAHDGINVLGAAVEAARHEGSESDACKCVPH
eukprot:11695984-Alexandrium_andersonii.AAC.1